MTEDDRRRTAYHEAGHAIVGMLTPGADPVRKVSIIPRGQALGVTFSAPDLDKFNYDEKYLLGRIRVALGGRVAEEIVFGDLTTGAESDIQQLTAIARRMVGRWGMSGTFGPIAVIPSDAQGPLLPGAAETSEHTQQVDRRRGAADRRRGARPHDRAPHREPLQARLARRGAARRRDARRGRGVRRGRRRPDPRAARPAQGARRRGANADTSHMTSFWRGFTSMGATRDRELRIVRGRGLPHLGLEGQRVPRRHRLALVLQRRATAAPRSPTASPRRCASSPASTRSACCRASRPRSSRRASRRSRRCPTRAVFFTPGGGSDAVDTAGKIARRYWSALGQPDKQIFVSRQHGYHGMNALRHEPRGHPGQRRRLRRAGRPDRARAVGLGRGRRRSCSRTPRATSPRSSASR